MKIRNCCCALAAFAALNVAVAAVGPWDADVSDFPRRAGEAGDSARILRAVASAGEGAVVWFPKGEYAIDAMLVVTNGCSLQLHKSAHLKAVKQMPFVLRWAYGSRGIPKPGEFNLFIRGGDFDGAGLAGCVNVMGRWKFLVSDATFRNGRGVGLQFGTAESRGGCEMTTYNLYFICDMPGLAGNVGFLTYVGDSHFTDMVIVDYTVGVRDMRWSNRYTRCHVWGGPVNKAGTKKGERNPEYLPNSIAFDLCGCDSVLEDCYADTAMIGYNVCDDTRLFNCAYFNNWHFKMDNPVVFAHEGGSLIVTGGRFSKNSPNATLYRRGKGAGRLIWRDNQPINFTPAETKGLDEALKKPEGAVAPVRKAADFRIRDPFVLVDGGRYYLYESRFEVASYATKRAVWVRESTDLAHWGEPKVAMALPADLDCSAVWAPEVHKYGGAYWMFTTLTQSTNVFRVTQRAQGADPRYLTARGTWAFRSSSPTGPFVAVKDGPLPPREAMTLDGTLYVEDGQPYMVYCHEWCQMANGTIEYAPLKPDFTGFSAAPRKLLDARSALKGAGFVTDGPFFWRSEKSGKLYMIWSNFVEGEDYCVLIRRSDSGKIAGPWTRDRLLRGKDGGHGMIFKGLDGKLRLSLHQPNKSPHERFVLIDLVDDGEWLRMADR